MRLLEGEESAYRTEMEAKNRFKSCGKIIAPKIRCGKHEASVGKTFYCERCAKKNMVVRS